MMFKTHAAMGYLFAVLAIAFLQIVQPILFLTIVLFFSLFPDIDHEDSAITHNAVFPMKLITWVFKHRGFVHTIYPPLIMAGSLYFLHPGSACALFIGYISHLFADSLTKIGIRPFRPLWNFKIYSWVHTGGKAEQVIFTLLIVLTSALIWYFRL